ncbi:sensor histidine kinase [Marinoscillum furvescens]|uniref:sensor histidine kinase n=1 Tax=Marinoscillum furvescens TaxID=1026 RepID=UPI0011C06CF8|nr:HAMP domain-containing sensor histidine kinase [Marinoscillum furvescens]
MKLANASKIGFYSFLLISLLGIVVGGVIGTSDKNAREVIAENLNSLVNEQYRDLVDFERQLGVYTNPFAIADNGSFSKRVFVNGGLVYWNDNSFWPEYSALKLSDSLYTLKGSYGIRIIQRKEIITDHDVIEVFSSLSVMNTPPVKNQYLDVSFNPRIFEQYPVEIDRSGEPYPFKDQVLFYAVTLDREKGWVEVMQLLSLLLFGLLLIWGASSFVRYPQSKPWLKFVVIGFGLLILRLVLYGYARLYVDVWELFNPVFFTASIINPTLGDLLLNTLWGLGTLVALYYALRDLSIKEQKLKVQWALIGSVVLAYFGVAHLLYETVWLILEHSQLELDISDSITFTFLRGVAYMCIVNMGLLLLVIFSIGHQLMLQSTLSGIGKTLLLVLVYALGFLVFGGFAFNYLGVAFLLWVTVQVLGLNKVIGTLKYQTFIYLVMVFSAVAFIAALGVYKHSEKDELVAKEKFANRLLIKNDILGEFYLSQILNEISEDRYVRTRLMSRLLARQNIREKIKRQFLSSYFKKYDINVYLFDADGSSLQPEVNDWGFGQWQSEYAKPTYSTDYDNIFFVQDRKENVRNKYVCFLEVNAYGRQVGYIVLDLTLKKFIPSSVFPELLLESKYHMGSMDEFDYAVFKNGEILYKQGRYSFENKLNAKDISGEKLYKQGLERDGHHYFGLKTQDDRIILIVSKTYEIQSILSNFSFVFLILIFVVATSFLIIRAFTESHRFNLSTKIQLYLGLSFLLPMTVVSIALINTLNKSYREEIDRNFQKRSYNLAENLIDESESFFDNLINIDEYANEISRAAALSQADLNIYDTKGRLVTSSQPEIYRLGLLSNLLDNDAYYQIKYKREQNMIAEQTIGALDFKTSYTALRSYQDGRLLAILAMPYFDSKNHLRRQQVEVFNNLLVIFSVIFLISLVGGNAIVGQLVQPLKRIGDKLRRTSLEETNQPIHYDAQDEIGSLVKEYNAMLIKLEESKDALAVSQKESAWKEIARQVAHEIKNPLTPMRLKVQQLLRSAEADSKEHKAFSSLLTQIDSLSSIADSFSEFAKMPAPNNEQVDLVALVDNTINLYYSSEVQLRKRYEAKKAFVFVDPKIFSRILTNVLLNAIQSKTSGVPHIEVSIKAAGSKVILSIADNGDGISPEQREKIFTPYFSTKSKGSGIGLAVAKKGIENAGGNIWFESEAGKGTTFYISLPIHQG